ncbi:MAG: alanine racemase [Acidobacteria bacterium]|nr:MAG: alanine racemase [Acidobacteriota bacterium]
MHLDEIPTPALVAEIDTLDRNIEKMASFFKDARAKLRPHFKAHKTPEILCRQLEAGACVGVTCATVYEAEICAAHGVADILIANEPLGPGKAERCADIAAKTRLTVAADSELGLRELSDAVGSVGHASTIGILIDINVGMPRCGVRPEAAADLARIATDLPGLEFRGVMGYEGHAVLMADGDARESAARQAMQVLLDAKALIEESGIEVQIVSGGGTGTYRITGMIDGITEIQAGSYALMDDAYLDLELGFDRAAWVMTTVISRPSPHLAVADGGLKAFAMDHGNPKVIGPGQGDVMFLSDEHATLRVDEGDFPLGSKANLSIAHIDPTVNFHDEFWVLSGDEVVARWPIEARGYGVSSA